jgi:phosphohistidine swiveling domain-containing protein
MKKILLSTDSHNEFKLTGGGKSANLAFLINNGIKVPKFFSISSIFTDDICKNLLADIDWETFEITEESCAELQKKVTDYEYSLEEKDLVLEALTKLEFNHIFLAIRSSGIDEDSKEFSFAGQYDSFLFMKGNDQVLDAIKKCISSSLSFRVLSYRKKNGLSLSDNKIAIVVQKMIFSQKSGVSFSRHPLNGTDRESIFIEGVWGQGEGLVSGALEADQYLINRNTFETEVKESEQDTYFIQDDNGGVVEKDLPEEFKGKSSLEPSEYKDLAKVTMKIEDLYNRAMDIEWAVVDGELFIVQARPITNLPDLGFYKKGVCGIDPNLWDNSNIVESFNGVTTPLTFSYARYAYYVVYKQFLEVVAVPVPKIEEYDSELKNMLGMIRGRIYYNLINWYKLLYLLPGVSSNKEFMETMMGVKEDLNEEFHYLFDFSQTTPHYPLWRKIYVGLSMVYRFIRIDSIKADFKSRFNTLYFEFKNKDYDKASVAEVSKDFEKLKTGMLSNWKAPIINDFICMIFFGLLKKQTAKHLGDKVPPSLHNDLLCGQGEIESTMPTRTLMKLASKIDQGDSELRDLFLATDMEDLDELLSTDTRFSDYKKDFDKFIDLYGYRCPNEQLLEENDFTTHPAFAYMAIQGYVKTKTYSIDKMEAVEMKVKENAEAIVKQHIKGYKRKVFFWILEKAKAGVKLREELRLDRSKAYGVSRKLFNALGDKFQEMGVLDYAKDIFFLTQEEIAEYIDGRSVTLDLNSMAQVRKKEYYMFKDGAMPPDRFITYGAAGLSLQYEQILSAGDLLKDTLSADLGPDELSGTSCCPGEVEGRVRLAKTMADAKGIDGEILVAYRTDPGWVPLYPTCKGLIIEKGSLLSHSAVVAREMGIPTIVSINGNPFEKLRNGDLIRLNATSGLVTILERVNER